MTHLTFLAGVLAAGATTAAAAQELPQGELQIFAGTSEAANFLVVGEESRSGDEVEISIFTVHVNGIPTRRGVITQYISRGAIDCANRTWREIYVRGFSANGDFIEALSPRPARAIEPNDTQDFAARIHCDGVRIRPSPVTGHAAAVALTRQRLAGSD